MKSTKDFLRMSILENKQLIKLFGIETLEGIDWNICDEFAIKNNKVKVVCEYWDSKSSVETTKDLAEKFNMDISTVRDYLKKGTKLGWCVYTPKIGAPKKQVN